MELVVNAEELRAYFWGNMYLSSIQQGIQAQHCTAELFVAYPSYHNKAFDLYTWAEEYKTSILLNGGYSSQLRELYQFFSHEDNPYPYAQFHESNEALDGALTCVGIVLPKCVFDGIVHNLSINGSPGTLQQLAPDMISKDDYDHYLNTGEWRSITIGEPRHLEHGAYVSADLSWWEYNMALRLKQYSLAR